MTPKLTSFLVVLILLGLLVYSSVYIVYQNENAVLLRLGEFQRDAEGRPSIKAPGLYFKFPVINNALIFDMRLQTLDVQSSRVLTSEQKAVLVDYYVKWRIKDVPFYYTSTLGDNVRAQRLIEQQVNDGLRAEFGSHTIRQVVSDERENIIDSLRKRANRGAGELGIEVVDVRMKRIDLPPEVSSSVYERMRADRQKVAEKHRADGKAVAEKIRAQADAEVTVTIATARAEGARIRAEGDALAARVYSDAYEQDSEFYSFYRSIEAYRNSFSAKSDLLVLDPKSQFFKYFNQNQSNS